MKQIIVNNHTSLPNSYVMREVATHMLVAKVTGTKRGCITTPLDAPSYGKIAIDMDRVDGVMEVDVRRYVKGREA